MSADERDDVLRRVLCGELDPAEEPARGLLARSPEARAALAELRALAARLGAHGVERRDILARVGERVAGEERALAGFGATIAAERGPRAGDDRDGAVPRARSWRSRVPLVAAAAALLALLLWVADRFNGPAPRPDPFTLGGEHGCRAPRGSTRAWGRFDWSFELPPNGSFELTIRDARSGSVLVRERDLLQPEWTYDPTLHPPLAARIRWKVVVVEGSGQYAGQADEAEAWLD